MAKSKAKPALPSLASFGSVEELIEKGLFASRWFLAPVYILLCACLLLIALKSISMFWEFLMVFWSADSKTMVLYVIKIVDYALIANLVLIIILAGYENYVSRMLVAYRSPDRPSWMGKVDFGDLKLKLLASIVAITGINLLELFMVSEEQLNTQLLLWKIIIHMTFVASGVLLALTDYLRMKRP